VNIASDLSINTDTGTSSSPSLTCTLADTNVRIDKGSEIDGICAIVAGTITIEAGHTLSATGSRSLALFADTINIQGTVDVASHAVGLRGPRSNTAGCNPGTPPSDNTFGGNGGNFGTEGGLGGNEPDNAEGSTIGTNLLRGGCDGLPGRGISLAGKTAGASGGAVWIASDMGELTLGDSAVINASGAGGLGGDLAHGGSGGGSGGLIVLQSTAIAISPTSNAQIFANGGGGGGGGSTSQPGTDGGDPADASSGGAAGGGGAGSGAGGTGGQGYHDTGTLNAAGDPGQSATTGGGGGGAGIIRIVTESSMQTAKISPPPIISQH
jgi:hypothetical protein